MHPRTTHYRSSVSTAVCANLVLQPLEVMTTSCHDLRLYATPQRRHSASIQQLPINASIMPGHLILTNSRLRLCIDAAYVSPFLRPFRRSRFLSLRSLRAPAALRNSAKVKMHRAPVLSVSPAHSHETARRTDVGCLDHP